MNISVQNPQISVIMPVYNAEKYLDKSIESILRQSFCNFEFIIINDGSTDRSKKIIEKYSEKDNRIIMISRENKGIAKTLNEGIKIAQGKYIARMDSDDISYVKRLEIQYDFLEMNKHIDICGSFAKVNGQKKLRVPIEPSEIECRIFFGCPLIHPTVMWRRDKLLSLNLFYDSNFSAEDYDLWFRAVQKKLKIQNIPKPLLMYRVMHESLSTINANKFLIDQANIQKRFCEGKGISYNIEGFFEKDGLSLNEIKKREKILKDIFQKTDYFANKNRLFRKAYMELYLQNKSNIKENVIIRFYRKIRLINSGSRIWTIISGMICFLKIKIKKLKGEYVNSYLK